MAQSGQLRDHSYVLSVSTVIYQEVPQTLPNSTHNFLKLYTLAQTKLTKYQGKGMVPKIDVKVWSLTTTGRGEGPQNHTPYSD